jgi:hypothetical protein
MTTINHFLGTALLVLNHEAGGSGSASRTDPAMVAILERLTQAQERQEI